MKKKSIPIIIIFVLLFNFTAVIYRYSKFGKDELQISFIDVNQGDSSLIHLPYNRANILIDTGGIYNYDISSNIINYLKSEGIKSINFLIITHGDFDHMGSSINLIILKLIK